MSSATSEEPRSFRAASASSFPVVLPEQVPFASALARNCYPRALALINAGVRNRMKRLLIGTFLLGGFAAASNAANLNLDYSIAPTGSLWSYNHRPSDAS